MRDAANNECVRDEEHFVFLEAVSSVYKLHDTQQNYCHVENGLITLRYSVLILLANKNRQQNFVCCSI